MPPNGNREWISNLLRPMSPDSGGTEYSKFTTDVARQEQLGGG
eukprot:CAMPEP_0204117098 /NCGR_PEP_ID=MMETSP0361-20130328/5790_1 /ASSEMBLY_ACC=CAM_ASM_000343 /TAXON_ID=268821 /ORGANISM="Scrippsiella Hangoei, Strain SHTV-5" /LENGTH=42 /DNA_ID= /DNA_START= /DNA_END= /DNA_ORIENTATION=